jgi:hypothetical protein
MKKIVFWSVIPIIFFCTQHKLESRQYNVDYLMDLVETGNDEGVKQFFSQPSYVTKVKHLIEFTEIFRSKLEERFGYKPSYREAYDYFKANLSNMNLPKEQEKSCLSIFKEITTQFEKADKSGYQLSAVTMDYRGSLGSDNDIPGELAIAYSEALAGCLMCIIPSGISQGVGVGMIVDSARRTFDYLEKRNLKIAHDVYSDQRSCSDENPDDRTNDHDRWDTEY